MGSGKGSNRRRRLSKVYIVFVLGVDRGVGGGGDYFKILHCVFGELTGKQVEWEIIYKFYNLLRDIIREQMEGQIISNFYNVCAGNGQGSMLRGEII